jgi:hypothetical protein
LSDQVDGAQAQDQKPPKYDDMYQACPKITGLPLLNESVGNKIKKSFDDMRKTGIRTAQTDQFVSSEKDIKKQTQG